MREPLPPDYYTPVYRSLTQPILLGGLPKLLAIFLAMAFALVGGAMLMFPRYALHGLFAEVVLVLFYRHAHSRYKTDPHYFAVLWHNRGPLFRRERGPIRYLP